MNFGLNGVYIGIVINDQDPERRGRVQVYVPVLDPSLPETYTNNGAFRVPGSDVGALNKKNMDILKKKLSWASVAGPIVGGGAIGRYNPETGKATMSDSAPDTDSFEFPGQNTGAISSGARFNHFDSVKDAFADPSENFVGKGNFYGRDYCPENYVNAPKGLYNIPSVGARVLVGFINGQKNQPIVLGKVSYAIENQLVQEIM